MTSNPPAAQSRREQIRQQVRNRRAVKADRQATLFELILAGYRYDQIAQRSGLSVKSIRREVNRLLDERERGAPQRYINLQLARLDKAMLVVDHAMDGADLAAVPALLQLQAQYDRYEGFSARLAGGPPPRAEGQISAPKPMKSLPRGTEIGALPEQAAEVVGDPLLHAGEGHLRVTPSCRP
jgi:DNA-binding CsgD family transcriptional regulator